MKLYTYFRSSASYRVRIALYLKNLPFESHFINLRGGDQKSTDYAVLNPQGLVPTLIEEGNTLTQSLAIIEYLDEKYPLPSLLPQDLVLKAQVRAFALAIATDLHPLNNLRIMNYLETEIQATQEQKEKWYHHWLEVTFKALEKQSMEHTGAFCFGDNITLADICLIPQVYNALRFQHSMKHYPNLKRIYDHCLTIPAFQKASPEQQEDFSL